MDSFEETVLKAKEVLDAACKKTGEVVSVQKMKIELVGIKNEIEKLYAKLGEKYFNDVKDTDIDDEEISLVVNDIKAKLAEMEIKQSAIEKSQKKSYCKTCGAAISEDYLFCNKCGAKIQ